MSNALYPVAISVPMLSKTQALLIAKRIPRFRSRLSAVSTMMWRDGDEAPPLPKGSAPARLDDQELLVGCLVAGQHMAAGGRKGRAVEGSCEDS